MKRNLIILFLLFFGVMFSQEKSVTGIVKLENEKHKDFVVENAYVVLEIGEKKRKVKIDKDLKFRFKNIKSNKVSFSFEPKSNPNFSYSYSFDNAEILELELEYAPFCKYSKENKTCPKCNSEEFVVPIAYGLVYLKREDADKYFLGGCTTFGCDPFWYCKKHELRF